MTYRCPHCGIEMGQLTKLRYHECPELAELRRKIDADHLTETFHPIERRGTLNRRLNIDDLE